MVSAIIWSSVAMIIGGIVLSFAFRSYVLSDVDKRLELLLDTLIGVSEVSPAGEFRFNQPLTDQRFSTPYSGWYWQVSEKSMQPYRSRSLWDFELFAEPEHRNFSLRYSIIEGPDGQTLRQAEHDHNIAGSRACFSLSGRNRHGRGASSALTVFTGSCLVRLRSFWRRSRWRLSCRCVTACVRCGRSGVIWQMYALGVVHG